MVSSYAILFDKFVPFDLCEYVRIGVVGIGGPRSICYL